MKRRIFTAIFLLLAAITYASGINSETRHLELGQKDILSTSYITPTRIVWMSDNTGTSVQSPEVLLDDFSGQVAVSSRNSCVLSTKNSDQASILIDFGREYQGAIEIAAAIRDVNMPVKVRVRFGESVSEAMSELGSTATNEHAMRDFTMEIPWLGTVRSGESGFRFVRIDLLDKDIDLPITAVRTVFRYRDIPYLGSFDCDNERLNQIWKTGAYTVHLNMQNYLWDGIKRDRLVWLGDMHPEVMCISSVFGTNEVMNKSLDFVRDDTPLPGWMNGMCSYSLWWIITHKDLYMYHGDLDYLKEQHQYLKDLTAQVIRNVDGKKENLKNGVRFLDWPTSEMPDVIHAGLQALTVISLDAAKQMAVWLNDTDLEQECNAALKNLYRYTPDHKNNKQAASLLMLAGLMKPNKAAPIVYENGADAFSTFYGYYMLESLAQAGEYEKALDIISDYWGGDVGFRSYHFLGRLDI